MTGRPPARRSASRSSRAAPAWRSRRSRTSSERVAVRDARPDDADAVAHVHVHAWQVAYAHAFPSKALAALTGEESQRAAQWRERIEMLQAPRHVLVADGEDGVVGFATGGPAQDEHAGAKTGELYAIYVLPEAWGGGVGQALMNEVLERLHAAGFGEAILWVLEANPRTRRFYELGGWRLDGEPREDTFLDTPVRVVRYRIALGHSR